MCQGTKGLRGKVWFWTKILSLNIRRDIKICRDERTFWKSLGKKRAFWVKNSVVWARKGTNNTWYVLHNTQLNVQICKYVQKQSICRENSEHVLDESFYGHFCPCRNAANFCHPLVDQDLNIVSDICEKWPYAAYK